MMEMKEPFPYSLESQNFDLNPIFKKLCTQVMIPQKAVSIKNHDLVFENYESNRQPHNVMTISSACFCYVLRRNIYTIVLL